MEYDLDTWQIFKEGIYLIKGQTFSFDILYKVVPKDGKLYFCKVGGQGGRIKAIDEEYYKDMTLEFFEKNKKNFIVDTFEISGIKIDSKPSIHSKNNMGTITYMRNGKKEKYLIHFIHNAAIVNMFFKDVLGLYVDFIDREKEERELYQEEFNPFENKNTPQYTRISKLAKSCNVLACLAAIWLFVYPWPTFLALGVNLFIPLVGFFIYLRYNTFVELDEYKKRKGVSVAQCILFPSLMIALRALNFNIVYDYKFWIIISMISLIALTLMLIRVKEYRVRKFVVIELAILIFIYVFGAYIHGNCLLDESSFLRYQAKVLESRKTKESEPDYYLTLEPWGPYNESKELEVTEGAFKRRRPGMDVPIYLMEGKFGTQWFILEEWYYTD